jgi:5-methylcytosine-specific restriction protein B
METNRVVSHTGAGGTNAIIVGACFMLLDERVVQELKERYQTLESKGELLSQEQLARYFRIFRAKFGPDKLMNLGDEALLESVYTFGNRDSLVYWLEFKNDDEFPSISFGSIAGGSAFKYGLFRKKETGVWTTGSPQNPVSLTKEQAIELARKHRSQLIKGAELLEDLPEQATEADYDALQREMDSIAPDVSNMSWGHKYFHLLYPGKLDDFHNPDYQRFHLIRLLQLPPEGKGRYYLAWYFVDIARQLNVPMTNLSYTINIRNDDAPYSYWRIGTRESTGGQSFWDMMRENQCIAMGWSDTGDLSVITNDRAGKELIRQTLLSHEPTMNPATAGKAAQQLFHFRWAIAPGDLVLASDGSTVLESRSRNHATS